MAQVQWVWCRSGGYRAGMTDMMQIRWVCCRYGGYGADTLGMVQVWWYISGTAEGTIPDLPCISLAVPQRLPVLWVPWTPRRRMPGAHCCTRAGLSHIFPPRHAQALPAPALLTRAHPAPAPWAAPGSNPTHEQEKPTECYRGGHRCGASRRKRPRWGQEGQGRGRGRGGAFPFQAGL